MELSFQPKTEKEYWEVIEELGAMRHSINHSLAHKERFNFSDEQIGNGNKNYFDAYEIQKKLVGELKEKFGIIPPNEEIPEGKKGYWKWYEEMKSICNKELYSKDLCSICPYTEGEDRYISYGYASGCGKLSVIGNKGVCDCYLIMCEKNTPEQLIELIKSEHGEDVSRKFKVRLTQYKQLKDMDKLSKVFKNLENAIKFVPNESYGISEEERLDSISGDFKCITNIVEELKDFYVKNNEISKTIKDVLDICYKYLGSNGSINSYILVENKNEDIRVDMLASLTNIQKLIEEIQTKVYDNI